MFSGGAFKDKAYGEDVFRKDAFKDRSFGEDVFSGGALKGLAEVHARIGHAGKMCLAEGLGRD